MTGLQLDLHGDLVLDGGKFPLIDGAELERQTIRQLLATNQGEWFLDWEEGLPFQTLFAKHIEEADLQALVEAALSRRSQTLELLDFSCTRQDGRLTVQFIAADGDQTLEITQQMNGEENDANYRTGLSTPHLG